jgi:hypothetical protein
MTKQQVVSEFLAGKIDRREFVRKLTTAGVSAGAAVVYAETLSQSVAARGAGANARGYVTAFQTTPDYPVLDTDGDGFTDAEEEACGSDPNDPNSTCDNVGGGLGSIELTVTFTADVTFNLPGGGSITIGAGSVITISVGVPASGGLRVTLTFNGTINGSPASFTATVLITSGTAVQLGGLRALAADTSISMTIEEFTSWNVPGVDEPTTPLDITVTGSGGILTVNIGGATTTISVTQGANGNITVAPVTGLPNTGTGSDFDGDKGWLAPVAAAGAGLALLSRKLRGANRSG